MKQTYLLSEDNEARLTVVAKTVWGLVIGAILGAVVLPMVYRFAANFLNWPANPTNLRWYCAAVGAGIGGVEAAAKSIFRTRRENATRVVADDLGLEYAIDLTKELEDQLVQLFGSDDLISVTNAVHRNVDSARLVVADMRLRSSSNVDSGSSATLQTIAYFSSDQLEFPKFGMSPQGKLLTLFSKAIGFQDIDFDDYPEFSDQYHLLGWNQQQVRQLFGDDLLQHFTGNAGWQIKASGNSLVMFRQGRQIDPSRFEGFIQEAMETFSLFMAASYAAQDANEANPESETTSSSSEVQGMPSRLAEMIQSTAVSPDELEQFLAAPTPRRIPKDILGQRMGSGTFVLAVMGCAILAAGLASASFAAFGMRGVMNVDRVIATGVGTLLPLIGSIMAFFAIRYRHCNYRLLRKGIVAVGKIEDVQRTDTSINNQRQFRLKIRFSDGHDERTSTCTIYGKVAQDAIRMKKENLPVRVLYDRKAPQRILWADSFALKKY